MNQSMTPYHHGDLRNCAIIAAAEIIESIGSYDITIAQVAKRVGVSAPALYRHFTDKDALLTAVRELTHLGIMDYITRAQADIEQGTLAHLDALGSAYLRYATDKKAFFGLMWEDHGDTESRRAEARAKRTGFQVLHEAIELYLKRHKPESAGDSLKTATLMWSTAHGIATLQHNRMLDTFDEDADADTLLRTATRAILRSKD
ncbi:transcriptional regulator [gamma proteobacterium HIMB55]|nr:transcriptional regulator [gamma proteobacterium HIMB55]